MNKNITVLVAALALAGIAAGGGVWWGTHHAQATSSASAEAMAPAAPKERKIRFYRNPMGLPDTSPTPKKDPMGMDYIPVYEGEEESTPATANQLQFSADKVQKMGVRTEAAALRVLDKAVHASGRVEPDERRSYTIAPRFEGYVEKLHVNATGQSVAKGQPLFEVYAPDLLAAQREYAIAVQGVQNLAQAGPDAQKSMQQLADASLARLRNWDVSEEQIKELTRSGAAKRTLTFRSPVSGFVSEKKAVQGMRFMPGDVLYQVSDLSSVWVVADVFEQDIAAVRTGARARVTIDAYPGKTLDAALTYVYPTLNAETRTVPVRLELANPGGLLKPGMYAQVELAVGGKARVLTVPLSAVIDSGKRQLVLVQVGEGRFEPRDVKLGARSDNYLEVLEGVKEGEQVVVSANFLIDAESNLKAAVAGFGAAQTSAPAASATGHEGVGKVVEVDTKTQSVTISHGAIASLKWPAMTMDFQLANGALLKDLKPDAAIRFEFVERGKGEWVITRITPQNR
ncbi:efflux RND transporter periplasmic adaptor subunit [Rhodoferax sp. GW822-FHT02A01]|uniref:efflux RND transporter periplasmic adaptor subunit n=1 Tax=Rhodoferax sp. GW822-FHT02A01 TaxID=3141537 RepID=UPI00315DB9DF